MPPPPPPPIYDAATWALISQGAESRIWRLSSPSSLGHLSGAAPSSLPPSLIVKERFKKAYRQPQLDASLTTSRHRGEVRSLVKCRRLGCPTPTIFLQDEEMAIIVMEDLAKGGGGGRTVRDLLKCIEDREEKAEADEGQLLLRKEKRLKTEGEGGEEEDKLASLTAAQIGTMIGKAIGKIHEGGVIHGDLTTSNMMIRLRSSPPASGAAASSSSSSSSSTAKCELILLDFGLSTSGGQLGNNVNSDAHEERAVDLYVFERALLSTHSSLSSTSSSSLPSSSASAPSDEGESIGPDGELRRPAQPSVADAVLVEAINAYKNNCRFGDAVMQRLASVRIRGRKRECFG